MPIFHGHIRDFDAVYTFSSFVYISISSFLVVDA